MRMIDMQTWKRRQHFELFRTFDHPHFNLCANVDLTIFYPYIKRQGISFNTAIVYLLARTANEIPEFRYRIRGDTVIEHEIVHPSTTILTEDELFSFCLIEYSLDFDDFAQRAAERVRCAQTTPSLEDGPQPDELLFMTAIPWVSFTGFMHPVHLNPPDSVPRFAWGRYFEEGPRLKLPLSIQAHHALMDGIHFGKFYALIQAYFDRPDEIL